MIPVNLPQLSISMEEGKVLRWLVGDGQPVVAGQPIVEIETDKATIELEAPADGCLQILASPSPRLPHDDSHANEASISRTSRERAREAGS